MKEFATLVGIVMVWIALNRWVLPWFGITTCMSGRCTTSTCGPCGPGPMGLSEKDASEVKGDQK